MNQSKLKKIKEIESRIPQEWRDNLMKKQYVAPDLRQEALNTLKEYEEQSELSPEDQKDYRRLKNLFDAGYYDAEEMVVDEKIAKKMEDFMERELKKAMKSGELPKAKSDKELKDYVKKLKKHERTKRESSIRPE